MLFNSRDMNWLPVILRSIYTVLFIILNFSVCCGQLNDSRYGNFQFPKDGNPLELIEKARTLVYKGDMDSSLTLLGKAKQLTDDCVVRARCYRIEGQVHLRQSEYAKVACSAFAGLTETGECCGKSDRILLRNLLGVSCTYRGEYAEALNHFFEAMIEAERDSLREELALVISNIGLNYYKMYDYQTAISYWEKALLLNHFYDDAQLIHLNIALSLIYLRRFEEAETKLKKVMEGEDSLNEGSSMVYFYALGLLHEFQNSLDSAKTSYQRSLALARNNDPRFVAENLLSISKVTPHDGRKQINMLNEAAAIASAHSFVDILYRIYTERLALAKNQGDELAIVTDQNKILTLWDHYYGQGAARVSASYKAKLLEVDLAKRKAINAESIGLSTQLEEMQGYYRYLMVILAAGTFVILGLILSSFLSNKKQAQRLERIVRHRVSKLEENAKRIDAILQERGRRVDSYKKVSSSRSLFVAT